MQPIPDGSSFTRTILQWGSFFVFRSGPHESKHFLNHVLTTLKVSIHSLG